MNTKITMSEILRWRFALAEAEAPPAPRAARLLELARPWWEGCPEKFQAIVRRLGAVQMSYGHAMVEPGMASASHLVPTLIVGESVEREASVQVLYMEVQDATLQLRFELEAIHRSGETCFDCTFLAEENLRPLFSAPAQCSLANEFWLEVSIPESIARKWENIPVTGPMPFRLILRPAKNGE